MKAHPHVAEETRIAEMNVGLSAKCADCGLIPGDHCRAHFVAAVERLRERAEKAEAIVAKFVAVVGRFRVKEGTATVMVDCDAHTDLIELYLDARKERERDSTSATTGEKT